MQAGRCLSLSMRFGASMCSISRAGKEVGKKIPASASSSRRIRLSGIDLRIADDKRASKPGIERNFVGGRMTRPRGGSSPGRRGGRPGAGRAFRAEKGFLGPAPGFRGSGAVQNRVHGMPCARFSPRFAIASAGRSLRSRCGSGPLLRFFRPAGRPPLPD